MSAFGSATEGEGKKEMQGELHTWVEWLVWLTSMTRRCRVWDEIVDGVRFHRKNRRTNH